MRVIHKSDATIPVSEVKCGQCFMKSGSIFMKAYRDGDYAVDLEDGTIYKLNDGTIYKLDDMNDQVFPIIAEVVVK